MPRNVGISNRETPEQEAREREAFPPLDPESPPAEDAAGRTGEQGFSRDGAQTAHKAGSRSVAQKEAGSKYADRAQPASRKVAGAHGRETPNPPARDRKGTSHPARKRAQKPGRQAAEPRATGRPSAGAKARSGVKARKATRRTTKTRSRAR
jgi:hypothetical protein